jgi:hypothetical protein
MKKNIFPPQNSQNLKTLSLSYSLGLNSLCVAPSPSLSLRRNSLSSSQLLLFLLLSPVVTAHLVTLVTTGILLGRSVRRRTFRARLVTPVTTGNQVKKFLSYLPFNFRNFGFGFGFGFPKVDFLQLVGLFLHL